MNVTTRTPQAIQLELIRLSSFNNFDGERVADDLEARPHIWKAVMIDRAAYGADYARNRSATPGKDSSGLPIEPIDFIRLRDLSDNYWNVDTVYILPANPALSEELEDLAQSWGADEIDWYSGQDAGPRVLRVWFD